LRESAPRERVTSEREPFAFVAAAGFIHLTVGRLVEKQHLFRGGEPRMRVLDPEEPACFERITHALVLLIWMHTCILLLFEASRK
jgi:hypothetical protein